MPWVNVTAADALQPGRSMKVEAESRNYALHNVGGTFYCTSNICPHQGLPIHGGALEGPHLVCPWHAWVMDVTTGRCPFIPKASIPCFPVKVEGGQVFIEVHA